MKLVRTFGNASVETEVLPTWNHTPVNPRIVPQIELFLSVMSRVYFSGAEEQFDRFLTAFLEEVGTYLETAGLGHVLDDLPPEVPGEMEEFMGRTRILADPASAKEIQEGVGATEEDLKVVEEVMEELGQGRKKK